VSDSERPIFAPHIDAQIEAAQNQIDSHFWQHLRMFQILNPLAARVNHPDLPPAPLRPKALRMTIIEYARSLYLAEGNLYQDGPQIRMWLEHLAARIVERIMQAVEQLEDAGKERHVSLKHHGFTYEQMHDGAVKELVSLISNRLTPAPPADRPPMAPQVRAQMEAKPQSESHAAPTVKKPRVSSQIKSESAARKVQAFMDKRALNQTEFAIQAKTTDKTIRKFLKTGQVKRSILTGIAEAMGISREELLR
jgi:hypothetical protein